MRKTKIVCTIGPATESEAMIEKLIDAGMEVARLNFSHGTHESHLKVIKSIRDVSRRLNKPITILQDLQGPKLRVGKIRNGSVQLEKGHSILISTRNIQGDENEISTIYENLPEDVQPGDRILLDDGMIQMKVLSVSERKVRCEIIEGGTLTDHKGINLPGVNVSMPSFTEKDREDLLFGIEQNVDVVAMSFVRKPEDISEIKKIISDKKKEISVIAKIEKPEAVQYLDDIIEVSDGTMIARGDLGVELPLEKVPPLQKKIIQKSRRLGKPVITATQMLESMKAHARPTRAEVSDVANAIFDGTDAVMLSAETSIGKYPAETVRTMARIIVEAEKTHIDFPNLPMNFEHKSLSIADAISGSACEAAEQLNARAIVAFTTSGFTAKMVSKNRPNTNIIVFTPSEIVQHQLNLCWGVMPLKSEFLQNTDEIVEQTEEVLLSKNLVEKGDIIVILLGSPIFIKGTTNLMKLHIIGEDSSK
ncbi:pyruvate kinase [candidate division KSB1 bacterium]|nr:pyruvate kinase [candidate division KSB1 bacterium]